jgi:hypothetical protein
MSANAHLSVIDGDAPGLGISRRMQGKTDQRYELPPRTINIELEYELQYWSRAFGVGREALLTAVQAVGTDARAVSRQLGKG